MTAGVFAETTSPEYEPYSFTISTKPEPAAWALMLAGCGGLGAMLRVARRRQGAGVE